MDINSKPKKIKLFSLLFLAPMLLQAQSLGKKTETIAIAVFFVIAIAGIIIYWIIWKNKKKQTTGSKDYKIKTVEVIRNGRKVVMTKKYREASDEEFPNAVKRKK